MGSTRAPSCLVNPAAAAVVTRASSVREEGPLLFSAHPSISPCFRGPPTFWNMWAASLLLGVRGGGMLGRLGHRAGFSGGVRTGLDLNGRDSTGQGRLVLKGKQQMQGRGWGWSGAFKWRLWERGS